MGADKQKPTNLDGAGIRALLAFRQQGGSRTALRDIVAREYDLSIDAAEAHLRLWFSAGYLVERGGNVELTSAAHDQLQENILENDVETEVEDIQGPPPRPYDVSKLKVERRTLSVFQALRKIEKLEIVLEPDFQRAFVWDETRQSRLIESLLIRIPLPAFYIDATDSARWAVVDGLQRLTTLYRFCRVPGFNLRGLEFLTELNGENFQGLPPKYKVLIEDDTSLDFNNLLPETPPRAKFTIFSRVNTGGMQLNAQEIRHALLQGRITATLRELAASDRFLKATDRAIDSKRMADRELILRTLAFAHFGTENYLFFDDLDSFLIDSMEKFNLASLGIDLDQLGERFLVSVELVKVAMGRFAFRKYGPPGTRRGPINKAIFESIIAATMNHPKRAVLPQRGADLVKEIQSELKRGDFWSAVTYGTGKARAVDERFTTMKDVLTRVLQ
jgi:hypothetical protein